MNIIEKTRITSIMSFHYNSLESLSITHQDNTLHITQNRGTLHKKRKIHSHHLCKIIHYDANKCKNTHHGKIINTHIHTDHGKKINIHLDGVKLATPYLQFYILILPSI
jgi:hypothetical protein